MSDDTQRVEITRHGVLTGTPISAERAYQSGFVNELAEPGRAVVTALDLAGRICTNAPVAVQACVTAMNNLLAEADDAGWSATVAAIEEIRHSADSQEGVKAFLEKRAPVWTGH